MGSYYKAMRWTRLCLVLLSLYLPASLQSECCYKKVVSGSNDGLDGTFIFKRKFEGEKDPICSNDCIYSKEGRDGEEYCFKVVSSDAPEINEECQAPPPSPQPLPPRTGCGFFDSIFDEFDLQPSHDFTFDTFDNCPQPAKSASSFQFDSLLPSLSLTFDGFDSPFDSPFDI